MASHFTSFYSISEDADARTSPVCVDIEDDDDDAEGIRDEEALDTDEDDDNDPGLDTDVSDGM
jgi:hypothetical protein